jgi:Do/DeqQ family serine protease
MKIVKWLPALATLAAFIFSAQLSALAEEGPAQALEKMLNAMSGDKAGPSGAPEAPAKRVPFGRKDMQMSFAPLVKAAGPAVVNVYAARRVAQRSPFADDPFFDQFFGQSFQGPPRVQSSLGSGVVVEENGIVVTNNHVIANADELKIALADGREFGCKILLKDERSDLAVLKISADEKFPSLKLADSDAIEVGDLVLAIGDPFGVGQTTTSGIISALARNQVGVSDFGFFIQTDAAINPGNSGGALLNMAGEVIGINSAIFSKSGGSVGIGFAIPSNMVRAVLSAAENGGAQFDRPFIGATFEPVSPEIADSLGMERPAGALVIGLTHGGPGEKAGLKVGDVILKMDGNDVEHPDALGYRLSTKGIGKTAEFEVLSRNTRGIVKVLLEKAPETVPADEKTLAGDNPFAGCVVANLSPRLAERLRISADREGVVVSKVLQNSPAMSVGLQPGDIVLELNGEIVKDTEQLAKLVQDRPLFWKFKIDRGGQIIRQFFR